jgi:hypothetical protein
MIFMPKYVPDAGDAVPTDVWIHGRLVDWAGEPLQIRVHVLTTAQGISSTCRAPIILKQPIFDRAQFREAVLEVSRAVYSMVGGPFCEEQELQCERDSK